MQGSGPTGTEQRCQQRTEAAHEEQEGSRVGREVECRKLVGRAETTQMPVCVGLGFLTMAGAFKVRLAGPTGLQGPGDSEKAS